MREALASGVKPPNSAILIDFKESLTTLSTRNTRKSMLVRSLIPAAKRHQVHKRSYDGKSSQSSRRTIGRSHLLPYIDLGKNVDIRKKTFMYQKLDNRIYQDHECLLHGQSRSSAAHHYLPSTERPGETLHIP